MAEQEKNSTTVDPNTSRINQLFSNQEIIVNKINDHNKALNELHAATMEQKEYLSTLIESYKALMTSQSKIGETVLSFEEKLKADEARYEELKQQLGQIINNMVIEGSDEGSQKIIEEQTKVIDQFHKTHSKLAMQITEKQKELELHAEENRKLMEQINNRRWEMLDLTAKYNTEYIALQKKLNNLYVGMGILAFVVVGLIIKQFI